MTRPQQMPSDWADKRAGKIAKNCTHGPTNGGVMRLCTTCVAAALRVERALLLSLGRGTCCSVSFSTRESVGLFRTSDMKDDRFHAGDCPVIAAWIEELT